MERGIVGIIAATWVLGLGACGGGVTISDERAKPLPSLSEISPEQWAALSQRRIFFGHQSVGGNIVAGITELLAGHAEIRLNIVEARDLDRRADPGFYHAAVGRNDYPLEKFDDFQSVASGGFDGRAGIAMVKLCYTDIHKNTDPQVLFNDYLRRVTDLKNRNPSLTIVHVTTPLTSIENWKGVVMSSIRGFATQRERNAIRHRYNELLRRAYLGKEPLFDLAALESTRPDGRAVNFRSGNASIPLLAPEFTDDGGHLNAAARRHVAEQLLVMLARLEPGVAPIATRVTAR